MTANAIHSWAESLLEICADWEKAEKLVKKIKLGSPRRPTPFEMRQVYSRIYGKPADGLDWWDVDLSEFIQPYGKKTVVD